MIVFEIPLPSRDCHPNTTRSKHYQQVATAKRKARKASAEAAGIERVLAGNPDPLDCAEVSFILYNKTARRHDPDNVIAWMKPVIDGLEDARIVSNDRDLYYAPPIQVKDAAKPRLKVIVMPKKKPDPNYTNMVVEAENKFCWACGIQCQPYGYETYRHVPWYAPFMIERAHIVGGPGRIECRQVVNLLCSLCHSLNHRSVHRVEGTVLPFLERSHMIWLKQKFDPEFFDIELLNQQSIGICPDPEEPPQWFISSLQARRNF